MILINKKFIQTAFLIIAFSSQAFATRYYVRKSGDDNNDGLTPATAWATVSEAASNKAITGGDTVIIGKGEYLESISISHSGLPGNPIVYYGDYTGVYTGDGPGEIMIGIIGSKYACEVKQENSIKLIRITFRNAKISGLKLFKTYDIRIFECKFVSNSDYGIFSTSSKPGLIEIDTDTIYNKNKAGICFNRPEKGLHLDIKNNFIDSSKTGISLVGSNVDSIYNNVINDVWGYGIYLYRVDQINIISNNVISNVSGYGIYLYRVDQINTISNNEIFNVTGNDALYLDLNTCNEIKNNKIYYVDGSGIYLNGNCDTINNNLIYNSGEHGIYFNGNNNYSVNAIDNNTVHDCVQNGIYVKSPKAVVSIDKNTIYNNQYGIYWDAGTYYDVSSISHNRIFSISAGSIFSNKIHKIQNGVISHNLLYGNPVDSYGIMIEDNLNGSIDIVSNTIYHTGKFGIYGNNTMGSWRNNIITGHNTWGIRGEGNFNVVDSCNCVYNNNEDWSGGAFPGTGSFSEDPLLVDPDGADNILGGSGWQDDDLHIKSTSGSWHFGAWTPDNENSPCIDKGDPADDYSLEPEDNGDRINIGCYGNTVQASLSGLITALFPSFPDSSWILLGVPVVPLDGDPLAVYGDDFGVTVPDYTKWLVVRWSTEWAEYFEYGDTLWPPPDCSPGISHFIYQTTGADVSVDVEGYPISRNKDDTLIVEPLTVKYDTTAPGYNMFANPYNFTIDWSDASILEGEEEIEYSLLEAATNGWISQYAYIWDYINNQYPKIIPTEIDNSDTLSVWQGFWFIQLVDSTHQLKLVMKSSVILSKPSFMAKELNSMGINYKYRTSAVSNHWDWFLKLGVVSEDYKMQDVENGIGESSLADDAFDVWDAFEFRGQDIWGNFVQLEFVHADRRSFAYDIHAPFEKESVWKFKVTTNSRNKNKKFSLVWPQIRLVSETIKFSLYDSDNSNKIIEDLKKEDSYNFNFSDPDTIKIFYIHAEKVDDTKNPEFYFIVSQNIFIPNDMTMYVIPSEPLKSISANVNDESIDLNEIPSPPYVYYAKKYLAGSGSLTLEVTGTDRSGNIGNGLTTIQYQLMKANEENKLTDKESGVELCLPKGILPHDVALVLNRSKMNLTIPPNMIPKGDPIYIGPEPLDFKGHALLTISELPNSSSAGLYRHSNGKWEYISPCSKKMKISETGIYQIFCKSNDPDGTKILPGRFSLHRCYPNPFNSSTMIRYDIQQAGDVSLIIYDILGREVRVLVKKQHQPGFFNVKWDGKNNYGILVASGNYFVNLKVKDGKNLLLNSSKKVTLIK